jgi:hypothetical protein
MGRPELNMMTWAKRYRLAIALFAVGATVAVIGGVLGYLVARQPSPPFTLELAKATLTLGSGLILGGALKVLLDQYQVAQKEHEEAHELQERLLGDIRGVYDQTERARLTIRAQGSATTYDEQMQMLIGCQAVLLKFKRSLELRWSSLNYVDPGAKRLTQMIGYLRALQDEYAKNYQRVLDCQRYDEEVLRGRITEFAATGTSPCDSDAYTISHHTRDLLDDVKRFPVLHDLTTCGSEYTDAFAKPLHDLAASLLMTTDSCQELDARFDEHVDKAAEHISDTLRRQSA